MIEMANGRKHLVTRKNHRTARYQAAHGPGGHKHWGRRREPTVPALAPVARLGGGCARVTLTPGGWWETTTQAPRVLWQRPRPGEPKHIFTGDEVRRELDHTGTYFGWIVQVASQHYVS